MPVTKLAAPRLSTKTKLNQYCRRSGDQYTRPRYKRRLNGCERERDDQWRKNKGVPTHHGFNLCPNDALSGNRCGGNQVGRILARDRQPSKIATEVTGGHHHHGHQEDISIVSAVLK